MNIWHSYVGHKWDNQCKEKINVLLNNFINYYTLQDILICNLNLLRGQLLRISNKIPTLWLLFKNAPKVIGNASIITANRAWNSTKHDTPSNVYKLVVFTIDTRGWISSFLVWLWTGHVISAVFWTLQPCSHTFLGVVSHSQVIDLITSPGNYSLERCHVFHLSLPNSHP